MAVEQREVYLLPFPFTSEIEDHLFIVLSVRQAMFDPTWFSGFPKQFNLPFK
jgi:hypothetical protein